MEGIVYLNGRLIPVQEAKISVMDYGFLYGYGLFETMRVYNGVVFRLDNHLKRLAASAEFLKIPVDTKALRNAVVQTIQANRLKEARIRLAVSIGEGSLVPDLNSCREPTVFVAARVFTGYKPEIYNKGYSIMVSSLKRSSRTPLPRMKTANYLANLLSRREALSGGANDALLLNEKNYITETSTSNIFFSANHILRTPRPENGLLSGITRDVVRELAAQGGIEVVEADIRLAELLKADEVFLTNSIIEIMPVTAVNSKTVNSGNPGPITRTLMKAYRDLVDRETLNQSSEL